jgi:hypothetical protein
MVYEVQFILNSAIRGTEKKNDYNIYLNIKKQVIDKVTCDAPYTWSWLLLIGPKFILITK